MKVKRRQAGSDEGQEDYASANLVMRAELMTAITEQIREKGWTQGQAAEFLGVAQPRISDVVQGRVDRFSVDMLIAWLQKLGKDVSLSIRDNVFSSAERVNLTLFVCGAPDDLLLRNVSRLFAGDSDKFALEVVDVLQSPQRAQKERISSTPCLIKESPGPRIMLTGDMSASSVRWQLANAERHAQDVREDKLIDREKSQDDRQTALDFREREQDLRAQDLDKRERDLRKGKK